MQEACEATALLRTHWHLPAHLRSPRAQWSSLCVLTVLSSLAGGPVGSWPTLEPLIMDAGTFGGKMGPLDVTYGIGSVAALGSILPCGMIYDRFGGRVCGVVGAIVSAVGLLLVATGIQHPHLSSLLYAGYPLAVVGGSLNNFCVFSFLWILPRHQNLISGLSGAVAALSDALALLAVAAHHWGTPLPTYLGLSAGGALVAAAAAALIVPSHRDMTAVCVAVTGHAREHSRSPIAFEWRNIQESVRLMHAHAAANSLLITFSTLYVLALLYPVQQMFGYYVALLGHDRAVTLVDVYAMVYACFGCLAALLGGALCDRVGLVFFTALITTSSATATGLLLVPHVAAQVGAQVLLVGGMFLYMILVNRFAMLYAPPSLFGTFSGVQFFAISCCLPIGMEVVNLMGGKMHGIHLYQYPFALLGMGTTLTGTALAVFWSVTPPPSQDIKLDAPLDTE